jgi:hypothetical protein
MDNDEAQRAADKLGLQCGLPGQRYGQGEKFISLQGGKPATVVSMHGGNIVAKADDGEDLVLAYYEVGVPKVAPVL